MWVATQDEYNTNAPDYNNKRKSYSNHTHSILLWQLDQSTLYPTSILEIGSGTGLLAHHIASRYHESSYSGVELSQSMIDQSVTIWLPSNFQFVQWDFLKYTFDQQFYLVISSSVIHFMNTKQAIQNIHNLLLPWGTAIILDWCNDWFFKPIDRWIRTFGSSESRAVSSVQMRRYCEEVWFEISDHQTWWWKYWNLQSLVLKKPG